MSGTGPGVQLLKRARLPKKKDHPTSLSMLLDKFPDFVDATTRFSCPDDALALATLSTAWKRALSRPAIWKRYLQGSADMLARPLLNDEGAAAMLSKLHEQNFRAVVAELRRPGWMRRYPLIKSLAIAGALMEPLAGRCFSELQMPPEENEIPSTPKRQRGLDAKTSPKKMQYNMESFKMKLQELKTLEEEAAEDDWASIPRLRKIESADSQPRKRLRGQIQLQNEYCDLLHGGNRPSKGVEIQLPPSAAQLRLDQLRARVVSRMQGGQVS